MPHDIHKATRECPVIAKLIEQLKSSKEELDTLLDDHESGTLEDYSQFQCVIEDMGEYVEKITDRADVIHDEITATNDAEADEEG